MAADRPTRRWLLAAGLYAALVGYLLCRDLGATAFDDSYFFKRFALNAIEHGIFAWNLEDGPVHGSTSQAFQVLATLVTALTHSHFVLAVRVLNAGLLLATGGVLVRWCGRATSGGGGELVALLMLGSPLVLTTLITGMETALCLLVVAGVLARCVSPLGRPPSRIEDPLAAVLTVLVYLTRPDAAAIIGATVVLDGLLQRKFPLRFVAYVVAFMAVTLASLWAYYGTPLPLSFYMKTIALHSYGEHTLAASFQQKLSHFGATLAFAAPLLWIVIRSGSLKARDSTLALFGAAIAFWTYHLVSTNEIMGYRGRFYAPGLVPLAMAAARSWDDFVQRSGKATLAFVGIWSAAVATAYAAQWIPTHHGFFISQISWPAYLGVGLAATALFVARPSVKPTLMFLALLGGLLGWKPPQIPTPRDDKAMMVRHSAEVTTVRGVFDVARCLPPASTVYHSEMGVTGLVLLRMRVVDLVGIVSSASGVDGVPFEVSCREDQPEAIFLPHKGYRALNAEIQASPCFARYVRVVDKSSSPLHLREDLAPAFLRCATEVQRWRDR